MDQFAVFVSLVALLVTIVGWIITFSQQKQLEKLKAEIQTIVSEHDTRFVYLHKRRGDVIDEIYKRIDRILSTFGSAVRPLRFSFEESQADLLRKGFTDTFQFVDYYFQNRLYLDQGLCEQIERLIERLNTAFAHYNTAMSLNQFLASQDVGVASQRTKYMDEMSNVVNNDLPPIRSDIEKRMQIMLGANLEKPKGA